MEEPKLEPSLLKNSKSGASGSGSLGTRLTGQKEIHEKCNPNKDGGWELGCCEGKLKLFIVFI